MSDSPDKPTPSRWRIDRPGPQGFSILFDQNSPTGLRMEGFIDGIPWDFHHFNSPDLTFRFSPWLEEIEIECSVVNGGSFPDHPELCVRFYLEMIIPGVLRQLFHYFQAYTHHINRVLVDDESGRIRWVECSLDSEARFVVDFGSGNYFDHDVSVVDCGSFKENPEECLAQIRIKQVHEK